MESEQEKPVRTVECPQCSARWYGADCREKCVVCHVETVEVLPVQETPQPE